tara:strand:- start:757 stop:894 length:138 start_codon:yes stop_codon:yes gene_type:complete
MVTDAIGIVVWRGVLGLLKVLEFSQDIGIPAISHREPVNTKVNRR